MKLSRVFLFGSAAMFAAATSCLISIPSAHAQDSDQSAVAQASDVWGSQGPDDTTDGSDAAATPDTEVAPDVKPPLTVSGDWEGTISDNLRGDGSFNADFTQKNAKLTGTWSAFGDFGNVVGTVTSHSAKITFIFFPKKPYIHCRFTLTSTSASDSEIIGKYKFAECGPLTKKEHGTIDLSPAAP
jgi:hypothetical protein